MPVYLVSNVQLIVKKEKQLKIAIFGTGLLLKKRFDELINNNQIEIIAFLDNNSAKWGEKISGIPVIKPESINNCIFDKIIIMSNKYMEDMKEQLLGYGIPEEQISFWEELRGIINKGNIIHYCNTYTEKNKKLLIITTSLNYNGGSMAAVYLAMAAKKLGYYVEIACPEVEEKFKEEILKSDINVSICKTLPFIFEEERQYIEQFDFIVVNVFQMIVSALEINGQKPMFWWIHESGKKWSVYKDTIYKYKEYINNRCVGTINTVAVSQEAKDNFNSVFPDVIKRELVLGIPDVNHNIRKKCNDKIVFAIIGSICSLKGHHILIDAIEKLRSKFEKFEVWMIGKSIDGGFTREIMQYTEKNPKVVKYKGIFSKSQMDKAYNEIDVVVCASLEETLSMTVVEGMMHQKVCITTDQTGIAQYIVTGVNGLVCEADNAEALKNCMEWVLDHPEECIDLAKKARETYEQYFTIDAFANRLKDEIEIVNSEFENIKL